MSRGRIAATLAVGCLCLWGAAPSQAAGPTQAAADPAAASGIVVSGSAREVTLDTDVLATLPGVRVVVPASKAAQGAPERSFEGPLLWTVLAHAGVVDPAKHRDDVRRMVLLTGSDGYTAVIALGEISPEFEGKQVVLALRADGQPLAAGHLRIVVPGDKRGGRGVHDLVRVGVVAADAQSPRSGQ